MNELFPIIRRKRRPFLVEDAPPMVVGNVEPPKVEAGDAQQPVTDGAHDEAQTDHEKLSTR